MPYKEWQEINLRLLGRRLVFAADEYYLLAGIEFPDADDYEGFPMHEDGVGMATTLQMEFSGRNQGIGGTRPGFFAWVEGAPAIGYRAPRSDGSTRIGLRPRKGAPVGVVTGEYGEMVLAPLVDSLGRDDVRVVPVENRFFGGTTAVAGLLVGEDIARVLGDQPEGHRYLLPDVCLSHGMFLDGTLPADLPRPVEIIPTDGAALRRALDG